jgi:tetratricopeptide (TPR) repeat protein
MKDFFVSYNGKDRAWAEWIAWELEEAGYSVVIQAWDFRPSGNFVLEMQKASSEAERTIAVLSPNYLGALFTQPEWAAAFAQDPTGEKGILVPVRVLPCELQGLWKPIIYIDLVKKNEEEARKLLLAGVKQERAKPTEKPKFPSEVQHEVVSQKPRFPGMLPPFWNVTIERNTFFTGRESVLDELHQALQSSNATAINQPQALSGLGGVGKTQTAVEYAYRYSHEYEAVFWVKAETESALVSGFVEIAQLLNLPLKDAKEENETVAAVRRWLEQNEKWLLLCDNADEPAILKSFLPRNQTGHILLTSRAQNFSALGIAHPVSIKEMLPEEALAFVLKRIGREETSKEERHCAQELVTELGYFALAIEQAGAYIAAKQVSISAYLSSYRNRKLQVLEKGQPETGDYPASVSTTWLINFEQVEEVSEAAADILRFSAFLSPDNIPLELLILGRTALTPTIQETLGNGEDELAIAELLEPLTRYSLIRKDVNSQSYSIHRLVQEVIKDILDEDKRKQWSERVIYAVQKAFPKIEHATWMLFERMLAQAEAACRIIERFKFEFEEAGDLLNQTGVYLYERARYQKAEPPLVQSLEMKKRLLGTEHSDVASSLNNLATLYRTQGRYDQAETLYVQGLEISERLLGAEHLDVANSLNNLAEIYRDQGKYNQAEPLYVQALEMSKRLSGEEHPAMANILNNLAMLYVAQGKYEKAEPLYVQSLEMRKHLLGAEHPTVGSSLNNLAELYRNQGKYEQAELLYMQALELNKQLSGEDHPGVAQNLNNLALLYCSQGKYEKAEPLYVQALEMKKRFLGEEHPDVALTLNNLALLYQSQGKDDKAELLLVQALEMRKRLLGVKHPDVATSLNNLACLYSYQGKNEKAEPLLVQALELYKQLLGEEHPDVANSLSNLGGLYSCQGKYDQAKLLLSQALELSERLLGEDHPQTITIRLIYTILGKVILGQPVALEHLLSTGSPMTQQLLQQLMRESRSNLTTGFILLKRSKPKGFKPHQ